MLPNWFLISFIVIRALELLIQLAQCGGNHDDIPPMDDATKRMYS
jgi:hypothetical protein